MQLFGQVIGSCLIVVAVLWLMWRSPRRDESLFVLAPYVAFGSVWAGLLAVVLSVSLWWVTFSDALLTLVLLLLDPVAIAGGIGVLWIYRNEVAVDPLQATTIRQHRTQACIAITMGLLAVTLGYLYVMTHKQLFTPVGMSRL